MGKKKQWELGAIVYFVAVALPIPMSLFSWGATIMAVSAFGSVDWLTFKEGIIAILSFVFYFLAGTYLITYLFALSKSSKNKDLSTISLLPLLHIVLMVLVSVLSSVMKA